MKRFNKTTSGYMFDRIIFATYIILLIVLVYQAYTFYGYKQHPYIKCLFDVCENPLLNGQCSGAMCQIECTEEWCTMEYLTKGEYGDKPPFSKTTFFIAAILLLALAMFLNHMSYNRGKKIEFVSEDSAVSALWKGIKKMGDEEKNGSSNHKKE